MAIRSGECHTDQLSFAIDATVSSVGDLTPTGTRRNALNDAAEATRPRVPSREGAVEHPEGRARTTTPDGPGTTLGGHGAN